MAKDQFQLFVTKGFVRPCMTRTVIQICLFDKRWIVPPPISLIASIVQIIVLITIIDAD